MVKFMDAGLVDNKLICIQESPEDKVLIGPSTLLTSINPQQLHLLEPHLKFSEPHLFDNVILLGFGSFGLGTKILPLQEAKDGTCIQLKGKRTIKKGQNVKEDVSLADWALVSSFFCGYAVFKSAINSLRGKNGKTSFEGWDYPKF